MLQHIVSRKRHGRFLPRSKVVEQKRGKAQERTIVSRLNVVKTIDLFEQPLPASALLGARKIKEIIFAARCAVIVTEGGICRAYDTETTKFLADLNPAAPWKKVTTAIYHSSNDTVAVVYEPNPGGLQCQIFIASALEHGQLRAPAIASDFANVVLSHPAFFEFDEANGVILAAQQGDVQSFQFWNHTKFKLVFAVHGEEFEEVRISHGLAALFKPTNTRCFSASVFDVEDGRRVAEIDIPIDQYRRVEFLELLVSKLLFKQDRASLRIIDLLEDGASMKVPHTRDTFSPVGFVFFEAPERVMGKKYLDRRARRFFTISTDVVQFWILQSNKLDTLHKIQIDGLREAGLCQQCIGANLLVVCPSHISNRNSETFVQCTSQVAFVSALELHPAKQLGRGTPKSSDSPEPVGDRSHEPTKRGLRSPGETSLLFFSMEDGQYVGSIPSRLCGENVEVLQLSADNMAVGCGNHAGVVRLLQASWMTEACSPEVAECASAHVETGDPAESPRPHSPFIPSETPMPLPKPTFKMLLPHRESRQASVNIQEDLKGSPSDLGISSFQSGSGEVSLRNKRTLLTGHDQPADGRKRSTRLT